LSSTMGLGLRLDVKSMMKSMEAGAAS